MINHTTALRRLLADEAFIHMPVAYDALGGRLIESTGFKSAYSRWVCHRWLALHLRAATDVG